MSSQCYAMIRGSSIRLTDLDVRGRYNNSAIKYATSKSVVKIEINEVTDSGSNEVLRNDDEEPRLHFVKSEQTVRYEADIKFTRCDPAVLNLMTGVPLAYNATGDIVGFDSRTRLPVKAFALEVWSKLGQTACPTPADPKRRYGYTLFPFLKGGTIEGFSFANGLVSFNVKGAKTLRGSNWGVGPYDLEGPSMRLLKPVSRNTQWKSFITHAAPPAQANGVTTISDIIDGNVGPDILDGNTGPWIVSGN